MDQPHLFSGGGSGWTWLNSGNLSCRATLMPRIGISHLHHLANLFSKLHWDVQGARRLAVLCISESRMALLQNQKVATKTQKSKEPFLHTIKRCQNSASKQTLVSWLTTIWKKNSKKITGTFGLWIDLVLWIYRCPKPPWKFSIFGRKNWSCAGFIWPWWRTLL